MSKQIYLSILSFFVIVLFDTCSNPVSANKKNPVSVTIWYYKTSVDVDSTTPLTGVVHYSDSTKDSNVIWSTSNPAIAEISSLGKVHGIAKGNFAITAKAVANPAISATFNMSVETTIAWVAKASMINRREKASLCVVQGKVYAIGGSSSLGATGKIEEYDPATDSWKEKAATIGSHTTVAAVTLGNKIYILKDSTNSTMSLTAYDPVTESLVPKAPLSRNIFWFGACAANGKMYVIGGASGSSNFSRTDYGSGEITATTSASSYSNSTYEYDTLQDSWQEKTAMPLAISHLSLASMNGKIFAVGGHDGEYIYSSVYVFDIAQNSWSKVKPLPLYRWGVTAVALNGHLIALGGVNVNNYVSPMIFDYDPAEDSWSTRTPLSAARLQFGACALDASIFIAGGWNGQGYLSSTLKGNF
jgi:N-acetylneuraminic acid mutarotase